MADVVDTIVVSDNPNRIVVRFTNRSDGTGETDVVKVDKSTLIGLLGREPQKLNLEWAKWSIQGFDSVQAEWDHNVDDEMIIMAAGNYERHYTNPGPLVDPGSAGGTGDVLFTTFPSPAAAGDTYDITMSFLKSGQV